MTDITPELAQRMAEFVRFIAGYARDTGQNHAAQMYMHFTDKARAIVAELPEPVDLDVEEAKKLARSTGWMTDTIDTHGSGAWLALQAIKRGRALEREGR